MASFQVSKASFVILIICIVVFSPSAKAMVTCGQVLSSLSPCLTYLTGAAATVPPACCSGVNSLNNAAKTTPDRQTGCRCLKSLSARIRGFNYGLAESLPRKCGVSVPYKISPSTDCNSVK